VCLIFWVVLFYFVFFVVNHAIAKPIANSAIASTIVVVHSVVVCVIVVGTVSLRVVVAIAVDVETVVGIVIVTVCVTPGVGVVGVGVGEGEGLGEGDGEGDGDGDGEGEGLGEGDGEGDGDGDGEGLGLPDSTTVDFASYMHPLSSSLYLFIEIIAPPWSYGAYHHGLVIGSPLLTTKKNSGSVPHHEGIHQGLSPFGHPSQYLVLYSHVSGV